MAFAFRKIISNIGYFKKPEEAENSASNPQHDLDTQKTYLDAGDAEFINLEPTEPDSTSIQNSIDFCTSPKHPETVKKISAKKSSLSDTDLLASSLDKSNKKNKKKSKKLKLDINKANQSFDETLNRDSLENTPKHVLLDSKSSEAFSERIKQFDFSKSFELNSDHSSSEEDNLGVESLSEDDDMSLEYVDKESIKMCRKVSTECEISNEAMHQLARSVTPESFADVEVDKNEEDRITLLLNYQLKFEKMECFLEKLLAEFQFHIEVSKIFNTKSFVTTLPGTDVSNIPKMLGDVTFIDNIKRGVSPTGSWNIIMEKEDTLTKAKLKNQLQSIQQKLNNFVSTYLVNKGNITPSHKPKMHRSITYDVIKIKKPQRKLRMNNKKKLKHYDFPDIREAMLSLFAAESEVIEDTNISFDDSDKCICRCHAESPSQTDSGLKMKSDDRSMSITSSIGNFTLDTSTLTAYSESLDQVISYNSFQDTSVYNTLLQKAAIERITFYVQAHSIQMKCETSNEDFENKNMISFYCPSCKVTEYEENGLLKHILSQTHCEKIHFLYKTAYIKKCVAAGKEIQPSTVLNPMKMYRDDNKIVCFGDAVYACSLCFENDITGESVLMAHCYDPDHVEKRNSLAEILE
ncbi:hypothetical protein O0L34_g15725 [Tuta absoluta]|nr:hypothetical protein O0L34_g10681 [Tuta absoluta]KAJ2942185.1 hypothetical protein O0L34_g15725 [Tuta absoluta]